MTSEIIVTKDMNKSIKCQLFSYTTEKIATKILYRDWCIKFATHKSPIYDPF